MRYEIGLDQARLALAEQAAREFVEELHGGLAEAARPIPIGPAERGEERLFQYVFGHGRQDEFVLDECVEMGFARAGRAVQNQQDGKSHGCNCIRIAGRLAARHCKRLGLMHLMIDYGLRMHVRSSACQSLPRA